MKKSLWEQPLCNLCGEKSFSIVYDNMTYWEYPGKFRVVSCVNCKLVYLSPRPVLSEIGKFYESDNYFGRDIDDNDDYDDRKIRDEAFGPSYAVVFKKKRKGKILDIGAGTGLYLSKFKEKGWDVDGIELIHEAVKYARKNYKVTLREGDFFKFKLKENSYDVVTLNGALEHMYSPYETLEKSYEYLKKGGLIIFSVPNVSSLGRLLFGRKWFPWQPPRHLYHYSPKTATALLKRAGFGSVEIKHNYSVQNKYILFQSMRYARSPKFALKKTGGLVDRSALNNRSSDLKVIIGKYVWKVVSEILVKVEEVIGKGEVMLVYAVKN